jgi:hypothetical protein
MIIVAKNDEEIAKAPGVTITPTLSASSGSPR